MNRRQVLLGSLGFAVILAGARETAAQVAKAPVIGMLDVGKRPEWWDVFRGQLRDLGYIEGQNVAFEGRYAGGKPEQLPTMARELVRLEVAVIVTASTAAALEAKRATARIPIVTATGADHVQRGLAVSLARPGRNVTGMTTLAPDLVDKRLGLLREVLPKLSRLAVLWHADNIASATALRDVEDAAASSRIALQYLAINTGEDIPGAFAMAARENADAVFIIASGLTFTERKRLAELALKHRLPTMHGPAEYVEAGGLLSYAPSYPEFFRRAALYVDKILKGAVPGELPIEQPSKFELVISLRTAKRLGVSIPQSVLLRADRVIE